MTSKERVLTTLNHEEPDKVPIDAWMVNEITTVIVKLLNINIEEGRFSYAKALGHDLLYKHMGIMDSLASIYKQDRKVEENLYQCKWGIKYKRLPHKYGIFYSFVEHPLADIKNYDSYNWPDPLEIERDGIELYKTIIERDGKDYAILGAVPCTIFEGSWYLRGLENFLIDLCQNRDFADELLRNMMNYHLTLSKKLIEIGVDIIWWGDDIAIETGPYIDPKLFRELIKPKYAYMVQEVKKINKNIKIAYHTDGKVNWVLDDLVDIGVDILNPLQPDVNDVSTIKKRYGKKLSFWGNVDTRCVMSEGSCADVVDEVKNVIRTLAPGGGFILSTNHTIQSTPRAIDNTIAYYWAAHNFRNYPIGSKSTKEQGVVDWGN